MKKSIQADPAPDDEAKRAISFNEARNPSRDSKPLGDTPSCNLKRRNLDAFVGIVIAAKRIVQRAKAGPIFTGNSTLALMQQSSHRHKPSALSARNREPSRRSIRESAKILPGSTWPLKLVAPKSAPVNPIVPAIP